MAAKITVIDETGNEHIAQYDGLKTYILANKLMERMRPIIMKQRYIHTSKAEQPVMNSEKAGH